MGALISYDNAVALEGTLEGNTKMLTRKTNSVTRVVDRKDAREVGPIRELLDQFAVSDNVLISTTMNLPSPFNHIQANKRNYAAYRASWRHIDRKPTWNGVGSVERAASNSRNRDNIIYIYVAGFL
jgi:hypothetical protein